MAAPPNLGAFLEAERIQESGNDYSASNPSGASGAYQFLFSTWQLALRLAKLEASVYFGLPANQAPAAIQDAAAGALMAQYYYEFGQSWYNVAEAWYGGPGAVGNPTLGGGPGYPDVGQYATEVIDTFNQLLANAGGPTGPAPPGIIGPFVNFQQVAAAIATEQAQRGLGDSHSREQASAAVNAEAVSRGLGDSHTREQMAAAIGAEASARIEGINHSREQAAALVAAEASARIEAINHTREQEAADMAAEVNARIEGIDHTREQAAAALAAEVNARIEAIDHTREQAAAALKALDTRLTADISAVLKYAQSLPGLIDTRAANGYDPTLRARQNTLSKLLDTVVAHEPLIAGLVSRLAVFIVDLAGVEDPLVRIAAQLILKQVIDRLGLDTALGAMLNDLAGSIIGGGQPKTLTTIMGDIGNRLDALESSTAELAPLAPEADQLHEMGTLIFDASLLAYFAAAVVAPVATATDTVDVFSSVTAPLLTPVRGLLGMP